MTVEDGYSDNQPPGLDLGMDDETPPTPKLPLLPKPSTERVEQARKYVAASMKESCEYMQRKLEDLRLWEDLYYNRRCLSKWGQEQSGEYNSRIVNLVGELRKTTKLNWRADFTIPCSQFVDEYVTKMVRSIFATREYLVVAPKSITTGEAAQESAEDAQFSTSKKIQSKLIDSSNLMKFRTRTKGFCKDMLIFGQGIGKEIYIDDTHTEITWNPETDQPVENTVTWRQGCQVRLVNPEYFLPDVQADSSDVQSWDGVGDRSPQTWEAIASRFGSEETPGPYNIGDKEFFKRWPSADEAEAWNTNHAPRVRADSDAYSLTAEASRRNLMVWERHGLVWLGDPETGGSRPVECVNTFITGLDELDPSEGVFVRHQERPILNAIGLRPYLVNHFIPLSGPLGMGLIDAVQRIIFILSHLINKFIDNVRLESDAMLKRRSGTDINVGIEDYAHGDESYPGKVWDVMDMADLEAFTLKANLQDLLQAIQYFDRMLQLVTAVPDATRATPVSRETATAFAGRIGQSAESAMDVLDSVVENYLEPYGEIALAYFAMYANDDQTVRVQNAKGVPTEVTLTKEEMRSGEYTVTAALDTQEPAKISKAQALMQIAPAAEQAAPAMMQFEQTFYSRRHLFVEMCRLLKVDGEKIFPLATPEQMAQMAAAMNPQANQETGNPNEQVQQTEEAGGGGVDPQQIINYMIQMGLIPGGNGGPMGEEPSDMNEITAAIQQEGMAQSPVIPGMQGPA